MKLLVYNWTQFDDADGRGGGVSVYLRNLFPELLKHDDIEITMLSAGQHYNFFRRSPIIEETKNALAEQGVKTYRVINSPIKAPAHDAFFSIDKWRKDPVIYKTIKKFIEKNGPFDAIHIHGLEGVAANILALKQAMPELKVFYTLHNYMPYCPQIELLHKSKSVCYDYKDGVKCVGCLGHKKSMEPLMRRERVASSLKRRGLAGNQLGNFIFGLAMGVLQVAGAFRFLFLDIKAGIKNRFKNWKRHPETPGKFASLDTSLQLPVPTGNDLSTELDTAKHYKDWREYNSDLLTNSVDKVFAVSQLVKETVGKIGEDNTNIEVLPLGMDIHAEPDEMLAAFDAKPESDTVTISFIGYAIPSKGLPFLMEAFSQMDAKFLREHVKLLIICRNSAQLRRELTQLKPLFKEIEVIDGYRREELPSIARAIDLNIVPSIWPETFNQVTFEMMTLGTPTLVSSLVGAKQLIAAPKQFVFEAGSVEDFEKKLMPLVKSAKERRKFFSAKPQLPTMEWHAGVLMEHYNAETRKLGAAE